MRIKEIIIIVLLLSGFTFSQTGRSVISLSFDGIYTTSAKIFLNPNSSDPQLRNNSFPISDVISPAFSLRYKLSKSMIIVVGTEYMKTYATGANLTLLSAGGTRTIKVDDGFIFIPVEAGVNYILPFSTQSFMFSMGGGVGYYFGKMTRNFGDVSVSSSTKKPAYGIFVNITMDYFFIDKMSLKAEMKFRDPQFTTVNTYSKNTVNYLGESLTLSNDSFESKINIDGVSFVIGIAYHF